MSSLKRRLMIILFAVGVMSLAASANAVCVPGAPQLIIYHAGSLSAAFAAAEQLFTQQTGVCVTDVAAGSVDAARRITTGQEPCDIFASADFEIIDTDAKARRLCGLRHLVRSRRDGLGLRYEQQERSNHHCAGRRLQSAGVRSGCRRRLVYAADAAWGRDRRFPPLSRSERLPPT